MRTACISKDALPLPAKKEIFIGEYMNNYTKFLTDLANMDEVIKDKGKTLIMLSSLQNDDYGILILTLINGKQYLNYNKVSAALVNQELRWKHKESSNSISVKALTARGRSFNCKGKSDHA